MRLNPRATAIGLAAAGFAAGALLVGSAVAQAATSTPSPTPATGAAGNSTATDPHPGDNGADGVPEAQESHGGFDGPGGPGGFGGPGWHGGPLSLSGTVTAVGANSVTIKTASGATVYSVTSTSDIDKNGEAALSSLAVGDAVRFSVEGSNAKAIDKLHAGNEAKDMPQGGTPSSSTPGPAGSTGA